MNFLKFDTISSQYNKFLTKSKQLLEEGKDKATQVYQKTQSKVSQGQTTPRDKKINSEPPPSSKTEQINQIQSNILENRPIPSNQGLNTIFSLEDQNLKAQNQTSLPTPPTSSNEEQTLQATPSGNPQPVSFIEKIKSVVHSIASSERVKKIKIFIQQTLSKLYSYFLKGYSYLFKSSVKNPIVSANTSEQTPMNTPNQESFIQEVDINVEKSPPTEHHTLLATPEEKELISSLITKLESPTTNSVWLLTNQSNCEKIHPLKLLHTIFSDETLKSKLLNISDSFPTYAKSRMMNDTTTQLNSRKKETLLLWEEFKTQFPCVASMDPNSLTGGNLFETLKKTSTK